MTTPRSSLLSDLPWQRRDREAHLLAGLLRTSRLTLLYGARGSGKTTLLQSGVLPLLRRRASDRVLAQDRESGVVVPFPDRRAGAREAERGAEVAVFCDAWDSQPLGVVRTRLQDAFSALPADLAPTSFQAAADATTHATGGARVLVILDHFEDYLTSPAEGEGVREFGDEFVAAVNHPDLPVNFLISLRDEAAPLLERFRDRIPGFGDASLRLPPLHCDPRPQVVLLEEADIPPVPLPAAPPENPAWVAEWRKLLAPEKTHDEMPGPLVWPKLTLQEPSAASPARDPFLTLTPAPLPTPVPAQASSDDSVQSSIAAPKAEIAALEMEAYANPEEPSNEQGGKPPAHPVVEPLPIELAPRSPPPNGGRDKLLPALKWLALPVAAALLVALLWPSPQPRQLDSTLISSQATAAQPAVATSQVAPRPPAPALAKFEIVTDAENSTNSRIAGELARTVAPAAGIDLGILPATEWSDSFAGLLSTEPRLAIVRYDALRTVRKSPVASKAPLRIITPLYTEEIYFIARADSPLTFIHEIKGRRINIGPAQSSRGLTAATLYQRMFGTRLPISEASFLGDAAALGQLVTDKTVDVMVVIAAQPAAWLADLPPETAHAIKLLKLDRADPASRKALQAFLPATVRTASYRNWLAEDTPTLAVMAFLVTSDTGDPVAAERVGAFAQSLCRSLPELQRSGHPKWREVAPGLQLDAGWPYSAAAEAAFRSCLAAKPAASNP